MEGVEALGPPGRGAGSSEKQALPWALGHTVCPPWAPWHGNLGKRSALQELLAATDAFYPGSRHRLMRPGWELLGGPPPNTPHLHTTHIALRKLAGYFLQHISSLKVNIHILPSSASCSCSCKTAMMIQRGGHHRKGMRPQRPRILR